MPTRPVTLKMSSDEGPLLHKRRVATRSVRRRRWSYSRSHMTLIDSSDGLNLQSDHDNQI